MAEVNRRQRYTVYEYSVANKAKIPREGELRFFDTIETFIMNEPLSVIGDGVSAVSALPFRETIYIEMAADIDISGLNVKGNIIRVQNTDSSDHDITTGSTPATYTIHPDYPRFFQFDGTNWLEMSKTLNFSPSTVLSSDTTLPNYEEDQCFAVEAGADGIIIDIPDAADNTDIELHFKRTDSNNSSGTLKFTQQIDSFAACPDGFYYIFLFEQWQYISVKSNGTAWCLTGGWLDFGTGGINTSDWTNRHFGDEVVVYNNQTVAFKHGEKVTEATSNNTGIIVWLNATTMILKKCTGTGHHTNARALTGSFGGDADVNGTTKNNDQNFYHGTGLKHNKFSIFLWIYNNATMDLTLARSCGNVNFDGAPAAKYYGFARWGVDTSNFKIQVGLDGIQAMEDNGTMTNYDTEDYSYNVSCRYMV